MSCDLSYLNNTININKEPNAIFWKDDNCKGTRMELKVGQYPNLDTVVPTAGNRIARNQITSLWVPPNMRVRVYEDKGFWASGKKWAVFEHGLYKNLKFAGKMVGNDDIDSIKVERLRPWKIHVIDCCMGNTEKDSVSPGTCGNYWGSGSNATGACDKVMYDYCKDKKNYEMCSCYPIDTSASDSPEMRHLKAHPICWSQKCADKGYIPTAFRNFKCPDIKICKQEFSVLGESNLLKDTNILQDCNGGGSVSNGAGTNWDSGAGTGTNWDSGAGTGTNWDSGAGTGTNWDSGAGTNWDSGAGTGTNNKSNNSVMALILMFFIIVIFGTAIALAFGSKNKGNFRLRPRRRNLGPSISLRL